MNFKLNKESAEGRIYLRGWFVKVRGSKYWLVISFTCCPAGSLELHVVTALVNITLPAIYFSPAPGSKIKNFRIEARIT